MAYNNVDLAYILPDRSLTDAQKLGAIQNNKQLEEQKQQRLYERQQAQEQRNLATIGREADFDQYKTGEQRIDEHAQKEIQGIYNEALANHVSDNPAALQGWLQGKLQPLAKWHTLTQSGYKQALEAADNFTKTYGESANPAAVKAKAIQLLRDNVMDVNGNRANSDYIQLPDFNAELNRPENLGQLASSTEAIDKFYHGLDKTQVHDSDFTSDKGFSNKTKWSGYTTPISDIKPDAQGNAAADVRHEVVPGVKDENGQPMKIIDDAIYKNIMGTPELRMAYAKKWSDMKPEIEQRYMLQTGKPMDASTEQMAFKHMIYKDAYSKIPHYISRDEATVVPKPPHITVNVNGGTAINDVASGLTSYLEGSKSSGASIVPITSIPSEAREAIIKSVNVGRSETSRIKPDAIRIVLADNGNYRIINKKGDVVADISPRELNLMINNTQKQEQGVLNQYQPQTKPSSTKKGVLD